MDPHWWIGRVAPRSAWVGGGTMVNDKDVGVDSANPEIDIYYNRVKVSVVGYHDKITNPVDLPLGTYYGISYDANGIWFQRANSLPRRW